MATMAILQEVDKCMRCNGCVIGCKRTWKMRNDDPGVLKVAPDTRVMIKSQKKLDMGPYVRYSCWHCPSPPCAVRCPFGAIAKEASGAVSVDAAKCKPYETNPANGKTCTKQCLTDCERGGYPKVGAGSDLYPGAEKAWKCTMCHGRAGEGGDLPTHYPTGVSPISSKTVEALKHEPTCVFTCPAKAMKYDTRDNIIAYVTNPANGFVLSNGTLNVIGDGSMFWASKKTLLVPPKADPFIEDHVSPMVSNLLSSPFAKAAIVPTLVVGGLMAISARRAENESIATIGEV